jgi:hypothetical protein
MKLYLHTIAMLIVLTAIAYGQKKEIDFRTTDAKGLTPSELRLLEQSRDKFFAQMKKQAGYRSEIKSLVIQGNKIKTIIYNTGSISNPLVGGNVLDLVWNGLGYGYEFGPLVAAKVPKANSLVDSLKMVSEGFNLLADGAYGTDGLKWGWLPKPGYSAPNQPDIASWGARSKVNNDLRLRPPSWPESWYNATLGQYVYPSYLGGNSTVPDEEVYFVVDDYTKLGFEYYTFPSDSAKRGLGINLEVRTFQYANPLAQDIIFLVYTAENSSEKTLPKVFFGMFGDPHIGGWTDYSDDAASFVPARQGTVFKDGKDMTFVNGVLTSTRSRNLVYAWDPDGKSMIPSIPPGYFGYKFLESPNNSTDGIDNDDDGIIDESPWNDKGTYIDGITLPLTTGIADLAKYKAMYGTPKPRWSGDENGNWDPTRDDVGIDGIPGTGDYGEGDGVPSQGFYIDANGNGKYDKGEPFSTTPLPGYIWAGSEPNFGFRDVNESDQIGLKSFWALVFGGDNRPKNNTLMYDKISSDTSDVSLLYPPTIGDNIFLYGSGPFGLLPGDRQRFSIALMMSSSLSDLLLNSEVATRVLEANYRFAQPPPKPHVTAVPGDGRVTLYWDTAAEEGTDPLTNVNDFEGYKIYRSQDYTFKDVFTVTDGNGSPFIGKALYDVKAQKYAQWHLPWSDSLQQIYQGGFHPAEYAGRYVKYWMGEPTDQSGLRHQYIDSTVTNGKTYYYAVVSFDHGVYNDSLKLPPTESQAVITRDAVTQEYKFDVNTLAIVPGAEATGLVSNAADIGKGMTLVHTGAGTGLVKLQVLNDQALGDNSYLLTFKPQAGNIISSASYSIIKQTPVRESVTGKDTFFVGLSNRNIVRSSVHVFDAGNVEIPSNYIVVDSAGGQVRANVPGKLVKGQTYTVQYQYFAVINSKNFKGEDSNPAFDGIRPFITDDPLDIDTTNSRFNVNTTNIIGAVASPSIGTKTLAPIDVSIVFNKIDTAGGKYLYPGDTLLSTVSAKVQTPFKIYNASDTSKITARVITSKNVWSFGDKIVFLTPAPYGTSGTSTMMEVHFDTVAGKHPNFSGGEMFLAKMKKPFRGSDTMTFTTKKVVYNPQLASQSLDNIIVVPNPYVIASQFEIPGNRSDLRGDRVIQFRNLPVQCTIRIYTITGELVRTLQKNDTNGYLNWDVLSSESARIGYGVYIYQVETPAGGSKIGRLAIIK